MGAAFVDLSSFIRSVRFEPCLGLYRHDHGFPELRLSIASGQLNDFNAS
jgi:hypothetical protein